MSAHHHTAVLTKEDRRGQKTFASYSTGFILCLILTIIPFVLVSKGLLPPKELYVIISILAVLQLFVQVAFFLRLNASPSGRWSLMAFLFAILVVLVLVIGSLWIMYNLNYNMVN
jgi:cytochrome o ubiquinol oxidase operon protein cyoD